MMKIVTANRLLDGAVVYLGRDGQWLTAFDQAAVAADDAAQAALLAEAKAAIVARKVVGAYALPVGRDAAGRLIPLSWRERIRAGGPSVGNRPAGQASPRSAVPGA